MVHLTDHREGFPPGFTAVTTIGEPADDTGIALGVHRLAPDEVVEITTARETAWLLMSGTIEVRLDDGDVARLTRGSLFDEGPSTVHVSAGTKARLLASDDVELTVYEVDNDKRFPPTIHRPADVDDEPRGKGTVGDACLRFVRTIFDDTNAHENSEMVLGEVVTLPGRWSSYPPHHHPQPEIYHYRFTRPEGYGHAELGDDVLKVKHNDSVKIFPPNTHAQCAAPGYGMYYAWVIRHLPGDRYTVPVFEDEHDWTRDPTASQSFWRPKGIADL
jgi:5-deoxy-glucuronate isomerase